MHELCQEYNLPDNYENNDDPGKLKSNAIHRHCWPHKQRPFLTHLVSLC